MHQQAFSIHEPDMQKSAQAALYSGLIFPGAGLYWLKRYWQAALFILPALAISGYVLRETLACAEQLRDNISAGAMPLDITRIALEALRASEQLTARLDGAIWALMACWVLSIAASYWAGRTLEEAERLAGNTSSAPEQTR
jgi:hypothetical protein